MNKYKIYVLNKKEDTEEVDFKVYTIWIDSYSKENSKQPPEDFLFKVQLNW